MGYDNKQFPSCGFQMRVGDRKTYSEQKQKIFKADSLRVYQRRHLLIMYDPLFERN